jgi:ketosteroid isomerase-like protein
MSQENVEVVRRIYEAFAFDRRDFDAVRDLIHPEIAIHMRTEVPEGPTTFRGFEGARQIWDALDETFEDYRVEPVELTAASHYVVAHCRQSGRFAAGGLRVEGDIFHAWRFRDGKAIEMRHFSTRSEALEAVGLSEQDAQADS